LSAASTGEKKIETCSICDEDMDRRFSGAFFDLSLDDEKYDNKTNNIHQRKINYYTTGKPLQLKLFICMELLSRQFIYAQV